MCMNQSQNGTEGVKVKQQIPKENIRPKNAKKNQATTFKFKFY